MNEKAIKIIKIVSLIILISGALIFILSAYITFRTSISGKGLDDIPPEEICDNMYMRISSTNIFIELTEKDVGVSDDEDTKYYIIFEGSFCEDTTPVCMIMKTKSEEEIKRSRKVIKQFNEIIAGERDPTLQRAAVFGGKTSPANEKMKKYADEYVSSHIFFTSSELPRAVIAPYMLECYNFSIIYGQIIAGSVMIVLGMTGLGIVKDYNRAKNTADDTEDDTPVDYL